MFDWQEYGLIGVRAFRKPNGAESGLDDFGARYYSGAGGGQSDFGRFMTPDWAAGAAAVPYAALENPQSLNLYAYGLNNPVTRIDFDGHFNGPGADPTFKCPEGGNCVADAADHSVTVTMRIPQTVSVDKRAKGDAGPTSATVTTTTVSVRISTAGSNRGQIVGNSTETTTVQKMTPGASGQGLQFTTVSQHSRSLDNNQLAQVVGTQMVGEMHAGAAEPSLLGSQMQNLEEHPFSAASVGFLGGAVICGALPGCAEVAAGGALADALGIGGVTATEALGAASGATGAVGYATGN